MKTLQVSWNSINTQPSDPLASHARVTSYSKSLMSYAQACHPQIQEAFLDPNSKKPVDHSLEFGDCINTARGKPPSSPTGKGPFQVLLTTDTEALGTHHTEKAPVDTWSCTDARDLHTSKGQAEVANFEAIFFHPG